MGGTFVKHRLLAGTIALLLLGFASTTVAESPLVLGVHPYLDHNEIRERFAPLADYLSQRLERPVRVTVGQSYSVHRRAIINGEIDIAFLGPALYVKLVSEHGDYPLLARLAVRGDPTFRGKIIARSDSGIRELSDLHERHFGFGSRSSTMSHLLPRYALLQAGIELDQLAGYQYLGSHDNVALAVLAGDVDAGAVKEEVLERYEPGLLRVIAESEAVSEHVFIADKNTPPELVARIRQALLEVHLQPGGVELLKKIKAGTTALVPAQDADYDGLKMILSELRSRGVNY
jgi:phosphonate transport system substrate-binding protein